jgi:transposase
MPGRNNSRQFNLDCVHQVTTGQKRPAQLCREHSLAESVPLRCRKEYEARAEEAFTDKHPSYRERALEARTRKLERFCGKLSLQNEILKGFEELPLERRHAMIAEAKERL